MVIVTVGNSYSNIRSMSPEQEKALRDKLSYTVGGQAAYFSKFGPRRKPMLSKRGDFPTGLLTRVFNYLGGTPVKLIDSRTKPSVSLKATVPLPDGFPSPYKAQLDAVKKALRYGRGTISMPTGTGKSLVIALLAKSFSLRTLVIVPSLEIKKQLQHTLREFGNIVVENIDSKALETLAEFDLLIIDEAHHVAAKTYQKLNKSVWKDIYYRLFLTATPFRNDTEEQLLFESIAGQVIYKLDYKTAIKENYIVPVEAYYFDIPKQDADVWTYAEVYKYFVVKNQARNNIISNLISGFDVLQIPTLCLVREVEHGRILSELTNIPFVSGADEASRDYIRQFNNGEIKVLIGTTGILGEGIDTKPCEYVVIAGLGKARSQLMQQVGRSVRKYPGKESAKVIIFKDQSHKFLSRHFNAQKAILKEEYGVVCQKLEIK